MKQNRAVFLDRDGVITPDIGYPHRVKDAVLFPDVIPALRRIQAAGYLVLMVTNQSGVGRGRYPLSAVLEFNEKLRRQINAAGINVSESDIYVCPHAPEDHCICRKPKPGLLIRAAKEHSLALENSFLIGDKESDVLAGRRAGVTTILLDREARAASSKSKSDFFASDLGNAAGIVLGDKAVETQYGECRNAAKYANRL